MFAWHKIIRESDGLILYLFLPNQEISTQNMKKFISYLPQSKIDEQVENYFAPINLQSICPIWRIVYQSTIIKEIHHETQIIPTNVISF